MSYSWSESFEWRLRCWCLVTVCISFTNWNVSCDSIYTQWLCIFFLHVFAIIGGFRRPKRRVSYWNVCTVPFDEGFGIVVRLPVSGQIHHSTCLSTLASDFTPKIIGAFSCWILGRNYTTRLFAPWTMTFPLTHTITERTMYLPGDTFIATHTMQ